LKTIEREDLKARIEGGDDFVLLEVLSEQSYAREHLPGNRIAPGRSEIPNLLPDKATTVVAYCSNFN
jgi:rhodanese-related sulfurtransferase